MSSQNKFRDKLKKIYTDKTKKSTEETSDVSSQSESYTGNSVMAIQEHARTSTKSRRIEWDTCSVISETDTSNSLSNTSLSTSITRFRSDFEEMKCKMRIFGESLNLCRCIAVDFKSKLITMEKRLEGLEKREKLWRVVSQADDLHDGSQRLLATVAYDFKQHHSRCKG